MPEPCRRCAYLLDYLQGALLRRGQVVVAKLEAVWRQLERSSDRVHPGHLHQVWSFVISRLHLDPNRAWGHDFVLGL